MKNRMLEIGTSGTVRGEDGNILTYSAAELNCALPLFCTLHTNEISRTDSLVQVDYVCVVDLDIGASKSGICAVRVVTISERAGRTRACNSGLV